MAGPNNVDDLLKPDVAQEAAPAPAQSRSVDDLLKPDIAQQANQIAQATPAQPPTTAQQANDSTNQIGGQPQTAQADPGADVPDQQPMEPQEHHQLFDKFGEHLMSAGYAAGGTLLRGFVEFPEQVSNLEHFLYRNQGDAGKLFMNAAIPGIGANIAATEALNKAFGRKQQAPIDLTGAIEHLPGLEQATKEHPIISALGNFAGGALTPGLEAAAPVKAGMALKGALHGVQGGGIFGGVSEAGNEIKAGQQLNPGKIAGSAVGGMALGGVMGGAVGKAAAKIADIWAHGGPKKAPDEIVNGDAVMKAAEKAKQDLINEYGVHPPKPKVTMSREHAKTGLSGAEPPKPPELPPTGTRDQFGEGEQDWRQFAEDHARIASRAERKALQRLALTKVELDRAEGKMNDAVRQVMDTLGVKPGVRNTWKPEDWAELQGLVQQLNLQRVPRGQSFGRAIISERPKVGMTYGFKTRTIPGKLAEIRQLANEHARMQDLYNRARSDAMHVLQEGDAVTRLTAGKHRVNLMHTRNYRYVGEPEKMAEYEKARDAMQGRLQEHDYSAKGLVEQVNKNPKLKAELDKWGLGDWLNELKKGPLMADPFLIGSLIKTIQATHKAALSHGINLNPFNTLRQTLTHLKAAKFEPGFLRHAARRITMTQTTTDVIDQLDSHFGYQRAAYLAEREMLAHGHRIPDHAERELINQMSPHDIRFSNALKGWTAAERNKEAALKELDNVYRGLVRNRMAQLEAGGVDPRALFKGKLSGAGRLWRMLQHDLEDLGASQGDHSQRGALMRTLQKAGSKTMTGVMSSMFRGKMSVHFVLHAGEAVFANVSQSPAALARGMKLLSHSQTARDFAFATAPRGMMEKLTEGDKWLPARMVDKYLNDPIKTFVEHKVPAGKILHGMVSGEMPERLKLAATSVTQAERVADKLKYPGGAEQYMADWMKMAKGGQIDPAREVLFGQAMVEHFMERNKAIMHMPEGPIQERTFFQRNAILQPIFPFMRSPLQQTRVVMRYIDDFNDAVRRGDKKEMAQNAARILAFHLMVATLAGAHTVPEPVWDVLDHIDHKRANQLRSGLEFLRQHNALGGQRIPHFGVRYFPVAYAGNVFMLSATSQVARDLTQTKQADKKVYAAVTLLSTFFVDNIGHAEGTQNLSLLAKRLVEGYQGHKDIKVYKDPTLLEKLAGKEAKKLGQKRIPYSPGEGVRDWALGGESPKATKAIDRIEELHKNSELRAERIANRRHKR